MRVKVVALVGLAGCTKWQSRVVLEDLQHRSASGATVRGRCAEDASASPNCQEWPTPGVASSGSPGGNE